MKLGRIICAALFCGALVTAGTARAAELPADYFKLMAAEVKNLEGDASLRTNPGAMLAAAVLYTKQHPANPDFGDKKKLELALKLGDLAAAFSEKDTAENKQDYEWEIHFWLDTYRLLGAELGPERRARWRKQIEKVVSWFAVQVAGRIDFPRYQGPYIRTSTNHLALFTSTVYLAGRVLPNKEWETLGGRALHRLAAEEQTADGYWGEHTDNGPATGYNYLTLCCVALFWEHSHDAVTLEALRRATDFHKNFTWPNGTPVEVIDGRNRYRGVSAWGHFGFSHWPDGRRYAAFLADYFTRRRASGRDLGRLAQSALYYHEGPTAPIPQELPHAAYQMKRVNAGIRKTGPWIVCLSGLIDTPIDSQFTLDRQGHLSIYHEKLGLIVTGANSKHQPELATFMDRAKDRVTTIPLSSRLRMGDERDRLGLGYNTFFAELEVTTPGKEGLPFRFAITETAPNRLQDARLNLQLCLKAGETLQTAKTKVVLDENRVELGPDQIGGWIRHCGWTLRVDPTARLLWPVLPFNPYQNAPETSLRYAVGALSVPVKVQPPAEGAFRWRRGEIAFALEAKPDRPAPSEKPGGAAPADAVSELSKLAATMKPGTWAELKTKNLTMKVFSDGSHHALQYTDEAVWDPVSRQLFFCGEGHGAAPRFVKYTESTNRWTVLPLPNFGPVHAYDHQAIDPVSGTYYRGRYYSREIQQYNVKEGAWSKLTDIPAGSGLGKSRITFGFEYFPEMRGLVAFLSGHGLYFYDVPKNEWRQLATDLGQYAYHEIARYNPVHKVIVFGGGNDSKGYVSKDLWKLDASGKVTKLREAPIPVGVTATIFTVDPVSGKYLVFGRRKQVYEYDVITDTWTERKKEEPPIFTFGPDLKGSAVFGCVAAPVSSHGVVMFVKYDRDNSKVYLYKHAAPGGRPKAPAPPADKGRAERKAGGPDGAAADGDADFRRRCQAPGVIRFFNFDSHEEANPHIFPPNRQKEKRGQIVRDVKASRAGLLRFEIPSNTPADTSGSFWLNFKDDLSAQFGEGNEFYVQWLSSLP